MNISICGAGVCGEVNCRVVGRPTFNVLFRLLDFESPKDREMLTPCAPTRSDGPFGFKQEKSEQGKDHILSLKLRCTSTGGGGGRKVCS